MRHGTTRLLYTAGHVVGSAGDSVQAEGKRIGRVEINFLPVTDVALVRLDDHVDCNVNEVRVGKSVYADVRLANILPREEEVVVASSTTASHGLVLDPQAAVTWHSQPRPGVSLANYFSESGDGGAAVLSEDGDASTMLWGLHGGRTTVAGLDCAWFTPMASVPTWEESDDGSS